MATFGLRIRGRSPSPPHSNENENEGLNLPTGVSSLSPFLNAVRASTHGAKLEIMKGANGTVKGIRKTAEKGKHMFDDLKKEIQIYEKLTGRAGWTHYILPFSRGVVRGKKAYLEMKFVPGKELFEYAHTPAAPLTKNEKRNLLQQTVAGLKFLFSAGILHGDLKDDNIYIALEEGKEPRALLFDFGKSKRGILTRQEYREEAGALLTLIERTLGSGSEKEFQICLKDRTFDETADYTAFLDCVSTKLGSYSGGGGRHQTRRANSRRHGTRRLRWRA